MQMVSAQAYLSREERQSLQEKSFWRALPGILDHIFWVVASFALVYYWANPLSVLLALFILGGKQLACAILMHDASHFALFKNRNLNDWVGKWLGAYPIFNDMLRYRPYHYQHHKLTGLEDDPDLLLTRGYPTSGKSMRRKFIRDFSGQTGFKAFLGLMLMHLGYLKYSMAGKIVKVDQRQRTWSACFKTAYQNLSGPILANGVLFALLYVLASPWLYLLWIGAYFTTFQFSIRVRAIAEHSVVEDSTDPIRNTRTTYANWWERLLFAPYHVNYHAEHHMLMSVPPYNLPRMHKILKANNFYEKGLLAHSYAEVLRLAAGGVESKKKAETI